MKIVILLVEKIVKQEILKTFYLRSKQKNIQKRLNLAIKIPIQKIQKKALALILDLLLEKIVLNQERKSFSPLFLLGENQSFCKSMK